MKCKICNSTDIIIRYKQDKADLKCVNGHTWSEQYSDCGGSIQRPDCHKPQLEELLFREEKKLYKKVLKEIQKNQSFFKNASPEQMTEYLIDTCKFDKVEIYKLFRKITAYSKTINL